MKIRYDKEVDVLDIILSDKPIVETDEDKPGMIFDYDKDGNIVEIEILDASKKFPHPMKIEYEYA